MGYEGHSTSVSTRASRLLIVGIRSDTRKEPIDSALADERADDSSMDARDSSWIDANDNLACPLNGQGLLVKQNNAPAGKSAAALIVPYRQRMHRHNRRRSLSFSPGVIRVLRQIMQQRKEGRRLTEKEAHCGQEIHHTHGNPLCFRGANH